MKKIINDVDQVENEMVAGMVRAYPRHLRKLACGNVLVRAERKEGKVALVTGGGSGHEPAFAGYVGRGMLDAVAAGAIYTSPAADQIYEGIKAVATEKGVLLAIMNYTGDIMNFEMARELAEADGIAVEQVVVHDDIALAEGPRTIGRRGVAGTVLVHKIAGAMAETGAELPEVKAVAQKVIDNVRTMGVAINPSTIPAAGRPGFALGEDEMEVGIGIHGEPGVSKESMKNANEIVDRLLDAILADLDYSGSEVAVMVNGSGGTPLMELFIANNRVHEVLKSKGIRIHRSLVGNYMTSIEQEGLSLTLLKLDGQTKALLDAEADTPAYKS